LLIISQPIGVGFSYSTHERGTLDPLTGVFQTDAGNDDGEYYPAISDRNRISKTSEAAQSIWYVLQAFYGALKTLDPKVNSTSLHIFTESYGGHYGPSFFRHIQEQNYRIQNKSIEGIVLNLGTLGIINGLVDLAVQAPAYAKFLRLNSHGIFPLNESMLAYMDFSLTRSGGCEDYVSACAQSNRVTTADLTICSQATILCRADVETMYQYGGRHPYDIRQKDNATEGVPQDFFVDYLNLPQIQKQLGVRTKYATNNQQVYWEFAATGDFAFPDSLHDLVWLLDQGLNIALAYGDADYECNWFGGEAISFEVASRGKLAGFANLSYMPFAVDGTRYGETRQQNGLSFTRVYNAGHKAPWYQPEAMRVWFERAIGDGLAIADGSATAQKRFPDCNPLD
jgi:carboxypeptidase C (cathepsin A)